jgi:hypothetical protein
LLIAWQNRYLPYNIRLKVVLADGVDIRKLSEAYLDVVQKEVKSDRIKLVLIIELLPKTQNAQISQNDYRRIILR